MRNDIDKSYNTEKLMSIIFKELLKIKKQTEYDRKRHHKI